jgi:DnaJ-class molecular chaperone
MPKASSSTKIDAEEYAENYADAGSNVATKTSGKKCHHGVEKYYCKPCGGKGICKHGRQKFRCKDCKGSGICEHGRQKAHCRDCKGSGICEHDREKRFCIRCDGVGLCYHNISSTSARSANILVKPTVLKTALHV